MLGEVCDQIVDPLAEPADVAEEDTCQPSTYRIKDLWDQKLPSLPTSAARFRRWRIAVLHSSLALRALVSQESMVAE